MKETKPWWLAVEMRPEIIEGYDNTFTLDIAQRRGSAEDFLSCTVWTSGLKALVQDVSRRLAGKSGEAVTELRGSFGGGKTHALLSLWHLAGVGAGAAAGAWRTDSGVSDWPEGVRRAVLLGTAMGPGQAEVRAEGVEVRTLWGELAWQLGGAEALRAFSDSDRLSVSPGANQLRQLLEDCAPCLILVDEWVAYARQTVGRVGLPGGDFEAQTTFLQALTEAVRATAGAALVITTPETASELGGEKGLRAVEALREVVRRVGVQRRPQRGAERAQVVRKRLFLAQLDGDAIELAIAPHIGALAASSEALGAPGAARRRLEETFPFHPSLFDLMALEWAELEGFQGTRGLLRHMAAVLRCLRAANDPSSLVVAGGVPLGDPSVDEGLLRCLDKPWEDVLRADVSGAPEGLEGVARALFLACAVSPEVWVGPQRLRRLCHGAGVSMENHQDAARRLAARGVYLHASGDRHRFETRPSSHHLARAFGQEVATSDVHALLLRHLELLPRGPIRALFGPTTSAEIADERRTRVVVMNPVHPHSAGGSSAALEAAESFLERAGAGPRRWQNSLLFLAPDAEAIAGVEASAREVLGWREVRRRAPTLGLSAERAERAADLLDRAEVAFDDAIARAWSHLLAPFKPDPQGPNTWETRRLNASERGVLGAVSVAIEEAWLVESLGPDRLAVELENHFWPHRPQTSLQALEEAFAAHTYLPRLVRNETLFDTLLAGISRGASAPFHLAQRFPGGDSPAQKSLEALRAALGPSSEIVPRPPVEAAPSLVDGASTSTEPVGFSARVTVAGDQLSRAATDLEEELLALIDDRSRVSATLVLEVRSPGGIDRATVEALEENCDVLGVDLVLLGESPGGQ